MLVKYVRDWMGDPVACMVAIGPGQVGVACCTGKRERFNKKFMRTIAAGRAVTGEMPIVPHHVVDYQCKAILLHDVLADEYMDFVKRSHRYFKDNT